MHEMAWTFAVWLFQSPALTIDADFLAVRPPAMHAHGAIEHCRTLHQHSLIRKDLKLSLYTAGA